MLLANIFGACYLIVLYYLVEAWLHNKKDIALLLVIKYYVTKITKNIGSINLAIKLNQ